MFQATTTTCHCEGELCNPLKGNDATTIFSTTTTKQIIFTLVFSIIYFNKC